MDLVGRSIASIVCLVNFHNYLTLDSTNPAISKEPADTSFVYTCTLHVCQITDRDFLARDRFGSGVHGATCTNYLHNQSLA